VGGASSGGLAPSRHRPFARLTQPAAAHRPLRCAAEWPEPAGEPALAGRCFDPVLGGIGRGAVISLRPALACWLWLPRYPTGVMVSDANMAALPLTAHNFHNDWNCTLAAQSNRR
jgi:hypothetical protein